MERSTLYSNAQYSLRTSIPRLKWDANIEYYLSALGFAVGFGSLWRFPYLVFSNGGGAFLIPYLVCLFVIGIPTFYLEASIGQIFQEGVAKCFATIRKSYRGIGVGMITVSFFQFAYYNLFLAYSLIFLWDSFKDPLPWKIENTGNGKVWDQDYFKDKILEQPETPYELGGINDRVLNAYFCILRE